MARISNWSFMMYYRRDNLRKVRAEEATNLLQDLTDCCWSDLDAQSTLQSLCSRWSASRVANQAPASYLTSFRVYLGGELPATGCGGRWRRRMVRLAQGSVSHSVLYNCQSASNPAAAKCRYCRKSIAEQKRRSAREMARQCPKRCMDRYCSVPGDASTAFWQRLTTRVCVVANETRTSRRARAGIMSHHRIRGHAYLLRTITYK